jgi:hypothetical protein
MYCNQTLETTTLNVSLDQINVSQCDLTMDSPAMNSSFSMVMGPSGPVITQENLFIDEASTSDSANHRPASISKYVCVNGTG